MSAPASSPTAAPGIGATPVRAAPVVAPVAVASGIALPVVGASAGAVAVVTTSAGAPSAAPGPAAFAMHRALARRRFTLRDACAIVLVPVLLNAALWKWHPQLLALWQEMLQAAARFAGVASGVSDRDVSIGQLHLLVPTLELTASAPSATQGWMAAGVAAAVGAGAFALPQRFLPLAYAARLFAVLMGLTLLQFLLMPESFPHRLSGHVSTHLVMMLGLIAATPWLFALTYGIMGAGWLRQAALATLALAFLVVAAPLQAAAHAVVLHLGSLVWLPALFLLLGVLPVMMAMVALYAWAMTWGEFGDAREQTR